MSEAEPIVKLDDSDKLLVRLLNLGNSLKPADDENYLFFEIVRELVDATLTNYGQLRLGYTESNYPLLAWACRNLLELAIFTKYVLISRDNARRFGDDRLIDGCDIITSLIALEHHYEPLTQTTLLDDALTRMQAQMVTEGVTAKKHLETRKLADVVGLANEYKYINPICSKLVHPTGWSVLAMNKGTNSFSQSREILFSLGVGNLSHVYLAVHEHNARQGMVPNP